MQSLPAASRPALRGAVVLGGTYRKSLVKVHCRRRPDLCLLAREGRREGGGAITVSCSGEGRGV
jgi:hypothetical protein